MQLISCLFSCGQTQESSDVTIHELPQLSEHVLKPLPADLIEHSYLLLVGHVRPALEVKINLIDHIM